VLFDPHYEGKAYPEMSRRDIFSPKKNCMVYTSHWEHHYHQKLLDTLSLSIIHNHEVDKYWETGCLFRWGGVRNPETRNPETRNPEVEIPKIIIPKNHNPEKS